MGEAQQQQQQQNQGNGMSGATDGFSQNNMWSSVDMDPDMTMALYGFDRTDGNQMNGMVAVMGNGMGMGMGMGMSGDSLPGDYDSWFRDLMGEQ